MHEIKNIVGIVAVALTFIGYIPYLRDVIKDKTHPHIYSWFVWSLTTLIIFSLQISAGAGAGAYVTLAAGSMCLAVFFLGLMRKGKKDITKTDTIFLILAFIALGFWLIAKQPVTAIVLSILIDLLGFAPTIRKSWNKPHAETLSFYFLNTFRFGLAALSLQTYTIVTALFPLTWLLGNGLFAIMLLLRRRQMLPSHDTIVRW